MKNNCDKRRRDSLAHNNHTPAISVYQQSLFDLETLHTPTNSNKDPGSNYVFDIMDALRSPILTFSEHWADTIPKRMLEIITLARLKGLLQKEEMATYPECVVYIYTRTLDAPMDSDWTDIYTHITCKTLQEWFSEDHWDQTKAPQQLSDWLASKLNSLRRHIYEKRRQMLKRCTKNEESTIKINKPESRNVHSPQQNLRFNTTHK